MKKTLLTTLILLAFALGGMAQPNQKKALDEICPPPENLGGTIYVQSGTDYGHILWWGIWPPDPVEDWLYYDNGTPVSSIGTGGELYWGIMIPSNILVDYDDCTLTQVALMESDDPGTYTLNIYYGGSNAPDTLVHTQTVNCTGTQDWNYITLSNALPLDVTQNLWITFYQVGIQYPAACSQTTGNANGRWVSLDGEEWTDLIAAAPSLTYDWMIRGFVTNQGKKMELVTPAEEKTDDWQLQYYKIYKSPTTYPDSIYVFFDSVPYVEGQSYYEYVYNMFGSGPCSGTYLYGTYQITAVYSDADGNLCESEPGLSFENPDNNYIYLYLTGTSIYEMASTTIPEGSKWYYEIENENGSITYQDLEYVADTTINSKDVKIIIRTNTLYDKDWHTEATREYIYKEDFKIYWWNKDLNEFTLLLNPCANVGDEWDIKVGTETITVHVDAKDCVKHNGVWYDRLYLSDEEGYFSGPVLFNIGNMTNFFPEKLMNKGKSYDVNGLRCYWVNGNPIYTDDETNCDAVWGIEEPVMTPHDQFAIYPNPTDGILIVETCHGASLQTQIYRITNLMGQTLMSGTITAEKQQIDVSKLPQGMYFISVGDKTRKFVVR